MTKNITAEEARKNSITLDEAREMARAYAPGPDAIPEGTRIVKVWAEDGDFNPIGSKGRVICSMGVPPDVRNRFGFIVDNAYFVEWDNLPGVPVFLIDKKIRVDA